MAEHTKPRIAIWHWGRRGGGPRYTLELARALKQQGRYDIHLSLSRQCEIFSEFAALSLPSFHVDTYNDLPSALLSALRLPLIRRRFWRYVREHNIDLVLCTMSHVWNLPVLAFHKKKMPYLLVLHDALPHPGDDVPLRHWLLKHEIRRADGIVTLTHYVRNQLCAEYNYPRTQSWIVPHGVFPYASPSRKSAGPLRLLFFGRILPYKGLDLLLSAYQKLRRENRAIELTIAGHGDIRPYAHMLEGVTLHHRWIAEREIGAFFENADIAVLPYKEASQSGVIAAAYAAGVPVVATPAGGLVEQVKHEQTGLICASATSAALADSLRRLHDDTVLRALCAEGALREAEETLAWPAVARTMAAPIDQLLSGTR